MYQYGRWAGRRATFWEKHPRSVYFVPFSLSLKHTSWTSYNTYFATDAMFWKLILFLLSGVSLVGSSDTSSRVMLTPKWRCRMFFKNFQKHLSDRILLILKIDKIKHFRRLQKLCLTDFRFLLSKCFFSSTFQILKCLGRATFWEKNTRSVYFVPFSLSLKHTSWTSYNTYFATDAMFWKLILFLLPGVSLVGSSDTSSRVMLTPKWRCRMFFKNICQTEFY